MLRYALSLFVALSLGALAEQPAAKPAPLPPAADRAPINLSVSTPPVTVTVSPPAAETSEHSHAAEWWIVDFTGLLVAATIGLMFYTARLWRETKTLSDRAESSAERQSKETQAAIREAARAADETGRIATATRDNALLMQNILHKQMRAYIAVDIGKALYQDERFRFEGDPVLVNTGFTPARNVSFKIVADILAAELADDFKFETYGEKQSHDATMSPRQTFVIYGSVKNRVDDSEVDAIMEGIKKRLYVWGTVSYDDVFGNSWETNFCHYYLFHRTAEGRMKVDGFYHRSHNNAT